MSFSGHEPFVERESSLGFQHLNSSSESGNSFPKTQTLSPGTLILNTYEVLGLLGRGGMGTVYRVSHRFLHKEMALKTLRAEHMTESSWRRFQVEAQSLAGLAHPNVMQILDTGIGEDGQPFYTMELLNGYGLEQWMREHGITIGQIITVFRQVASGLAFAHKCGVLHRNLEPSKIVLTFAAANQPPVVKIVDFGIVKLLCDEQGLTKDGEVFGSPLYMSPEQVAGLKVDCQSDIYSFGCALYETLTGFSPFKGRNAIETMTMHMESIPQPIELRCPEIEFPPGLSALVQKCLEKEPARRYKDAFKLAEDLLAIEQGRGEEVAVRMRLAESEKSHIQTCEGGKESAGANLVERPEEKVAPRGREAFGYSDTRPDEVQKTDYGKEAKLKGKNSEEGKPEKAVPDRKKLIVIGSLVAVLLLGGGLLAMFGGHLGALIKAPSSGTVNSSSGGPGTSGPLGFNKEKADKLYSQIAHFQLSEAEYRLLDVNEPYDKGAVYYLFPAGGERLIGTVANVGGYPEGEAVPYFPAEGLVKLPRGKAVHLGLRMSHSLALHLELLKKFSLDDLWSVNFPSSKSQRNDPAEAAGLNVDSKKTMALLEALQDFPKITELDTADARLDEECLSFINTYENLSVLLLANSRLESSVTIEHLKCLKLERLHLPALPDAAGILKKLGSEDAPNLTELVLMHLECTPDELAQINAAKLKKLQGFGCLKSTVPLAMVEKLKDFPNLKNLDFSGSFLPLEAVPVLRSMSAQLNRLALSDDIEKYWGEAYESISKAYGAKLVLGWECKDQVPLNLLEDTVKPVDSRKKS